MDINVTGVWHDYTGYGVKVGVYDDAVQHTHPDLNQNYDATPHFSYDGVVQDPLPVGSRNHGTSVAGIIAGEDNGIGGVGVAFHAMLTAVPIFSLGAVDLAAYRGEAMAYMATFDIVSHSWGLGPFAAGPADPQYAAIREGVAHAAETGREGLGTVVVAAAGNRRQEVYDEDGEIVEFRGDANIAAPHISDHHVITVATAGADGFVAYYSNPGANLLVTAPSAGGHDGLPGLTTTDRTGMSGYSASDHTSFGGTSAAAPVITGVVALMLEANADLGWRDVKEILAMSSRRVGSELGEDPVNYERNPWQINHATNWNGGGMHFSCDYGFGYVDAHAAVRLAETWSGAKTSANEAKESDTFKLLDGPDAIPDDDEVGLTYTFDVVDATASRPSTSSSTSRILMRATSSSN